jgi:aryl-alcohol dehydrogenase-like predicted oxidoreductase
MAKSWSGNPCQTAKGHRTITLNSPSRAPEAALPPPGVAVRRLRGLGQAARPLGFGCSAYWAKSIFPERQALALAEQAIDGGIRLFDTCPIYGGGLGERRLGRVLRACGGADDLIICGKVGTHVGADGRVFRDFSPAAIRTSLARTLDRLGVDRLAGLHLHGPGIDELTAPLIETLTAFRAEGLVEFVGINSFDPAVIRRGLALQGFDSFMIEYNVIRKANRALVDEIAAAGRAAIIGSPIAQALFRPSMLPTSPKRAWEFGRAMIRHRADLRAARAYGFLNRLEGMSGAQAALAFALRPPGVAAAVFATTSADHMRANIAAAGMTLSDELVARIEALSDSPG